MSIVEELRFWEEVADKQSNLSVFINTVPSSLFKDAAETIERLQSVIDSFHKVSAEHVLAADNLSSIDLYEDEVGRGC